MLLLLLNYRKIDSNVLSFMKKYISVGGHIQTMWTGQRGGQKTVYMVCVYENLINF